MTAATAGPGQKPYLIESCICWLAIAYGIFLRVFRFWTPSLWVDEIATAHIASAPDLPTLYQRSRLGFELPVHHFAARLFLLFGHSEFFLRLPSILFGLAALALLVFCLRRLVGSRGALYAGAIFALNSRAILHTQDARMYALALFLTILSIYSFILVIEGTGLRWLALYGVVTVLLSYNQIVYTTILIGEIAVTAAYLLLSRERPRGLRRLLAAQATVLVLLAPLVSYARSLRASESKIYTWIAPPDAAWFRDLVEWPEISFALVLLPGLALLWKHRHGLIPTSRPARTLLGLGIVYAAIWPAAVLAARLGIINILLPRYLFPALLGLLILVAACAARANEPLLRVGLCVYVCLLAYFQTMVAAKFGPWVGILTQQDWRAASHWIEEHSRPGDVVLLRSGLAPVKVLPPDRPGVREFLAAPLNGFYRCDIPAVYNLPWEPAELSTSPYSPPSMHESARRAGQVFVLVNPLRERWDWQALERWLEQPDHPFAEPEKHSFSGLQLRVYRKRAETASPAGLVRTVAAAGQRP